MKTLCLEKKSAQKIIFVVLFLAAVCPLTIFGQSTGDVNYSGVIDIVDALMVAQYTVGLNPGGFQAAVADVNGNNSISIIDALMIAQYTVGLITEFPGSSNPTDPPTGGITRISLNGSSIDVNGGGAIVSGSSVTITNAGTYNLSGTLYDGQVLVDSADTEAVNIIFDGIDVTYSSQAPFAVLNAEEVVITLANYTSNYLADTSNYVFPDPEEDEPNATLFSKDNLTISGSGSLTVAANYNDGIATKDDLVITGGDINVTSVDDGIRGKNLISIEGGNITVNAGGDGLKSDDDTGYIDINNGTLNITSDGDAIQAEVDLLVSGGNIDITSGGGSNNTASDDESVKGLKGLVSTVINGGTININSADDCIHSNNSVTIGGGTLTLATADDGIHADTVMVINNGTINVTKSYEGIESASITINNGDIHVTADDDGINAAPGTGGGGMPSGPGDFYLNINGGYVVVNINAVTPSGSTGGDGLDCNGYMEMTAGTVIINGGTNIDSAIDYDGGFTMRGGFIVGAGTSSMAMAPGGSSSPQNSLLYNFDQQSNGNLVNIRSSNGNDILTFRPNKQYSSIAFSSPELVNGTTYSVYFGGSASGNVTDGLYRNSTYNPGTLGTTFTVSGAVTSIGGGGFPWGGM